MKPVHYSIKIRGLKTPQGTIPMRALKELCDALIESSERVLRLSIEGSSVKRGKTPVWVKKSVDFTITGIHNGSTVVEMEAPTLGEAAPAQIQQQDLWYNLPTPEDTAISLLSKSVTDIASEELDSRYFDGGVLRSLLTFKRFFANYAGGFELRARGNRPEGFAMDPERIEKVDRLNIKIPDPRAVVVSGLFNVIEHAGGRFQLQLQSGEKITGMIEPEYLKLEDMRNLWGKQATIKGIAHFQPSGKIRFIKAEVIKSFEAGEEIFKVAPQSQMPLDVTESIRKTQTHRRPLMEIWNKWPGEESIDELLSVLKETTKEG